MPDQTSFAARGVGLGLIAGLILAVAQVAAAALRGDPAAEPLRLLASVAMGEAAETAPIWSVVIVGLLAHLVLAAIFGAIYGLIVSLIPAEVRTRPGIEGLIGLAFGTALWLVNYQLIARALYPWFLDLSQAEQWLLHAVFFGLPLALLYAAAERRAPIPDVTAPPEGAPGLPKPGGAT